MVFTNNSKEKETTFGIVRIGEYFYFKEGFYIKTDVDDEDGDYYAIELESGEGITLPPQAKVTLINIKEIIYETI